MTRVVGAADDPVVAPLERVVAQAVGRGAPPARAVVVEDATGNGWLRQLARLHAEARARSVVAARTQAGLVEAVALGIGGAVWLPPATDPMILAFAAAHRFAGACPAGEEHSCPSTVALMLGLPGPHCMAAVEGTVLWRRQLGMRALAERLLGLAEALEVPGALLPGPVLVAAGVSPSNVQRAWAASGGDDCLALAVRTLAPGESNDDGVTQLLQVAGELVGVGCLGARRSHRYHSVYAVPSGERVGWWTCADSPDPSRGWCAVPRVRSGLASSVVWEVPADGGWIPEVVRTDAIETTVESGAAVVRVPGWVAADLARGRPAALLLRALAEQAERSDVTLWIGNVGADGLAEVLGLPGRLWIDGPAAPEPPS
jgi:hypothetical protein